MNARAVSVFINCPFDSAYKPCFEALIFTVMASGYRARCALEEHDAGDIRFEKLCRLIRQSNRSIHDLSRVEVGPSGLPRFNMPFEFGLYQGARRFGGKPHRAKSALVLVREPHRLPIYMSDAAGNDPEAHRDGPDQIIRIVHRYLHRRPDGGQLPGAAHISDAFSGFKASLPDLAAALSIRPDELDPFHEYRDYVALLADYLRQA